MANGQTFILLSYGIEEELDNASIAKELLEKGAHAVLVPRGYLSERQAIEEARNILYSDEMSESQRLRVFGGRFQYTRDEGV
jgi:hypothetical protein